MPSGRVAPLLHGPLGFDREGVNQSGRGAFASRYDVDEAEVLRMLRKELS